MNWFNGGFWGWIFLKTKRKWILRVPNKVVEPINSLVFYILSRVLCARGCYFWFGLFSNEDLQKQSGYYSQIIKETRDHITGCKAKLIVPAIGEGSSTTVLGASKWEQEQAKGQAGAVLRWWRMIPFKEQIWNSREQVMFTSVFCLTPRSNISLPEAGAAHCW